MRKNIIINLLLAVIAVTTVACNKFLDTDNEAAKYDDKIVWSNPKYAEGVLLKAYRLLTSSYNNASDWSIKADMACDDATVNVSTNAAISMSTGGWTSRANPTSVYDNAYTALYYINTFLANVDKVVWSKESADKNDLYKKKLKGEALALRAWWSALLLKNHAGVATDGVLRGYPIMKEVVDKIEAAKKPRDTYAQCVAQILEDCDDAIGLLPLKWTDAGLSGDQKDVMGIRNINRINGLTVKLLKSRVALYAASPAFASGSGVTWAQAAQFAVDVIKANNGTTGLNAKDVKYWMNTDDAYLNAQQEILWYASRNSASSVTEELLLPPSMYGKGFVNPSQSFAECFGDKDGYPISSDDSQYVEGTPYANRDPRMAVQLYYDGAVNAAAATIAIRQGGGSDAIAATTNSTRTGYYLRKFTDDLVKLTPGSVVKTPQYFAYARYTEALLNFAEAANQVGGPDHSVEGYTPRAIINAIRNRAGITSTAYVASIGSGDKEGMHDLIMNERRIELSFENSRFWDIRRWQMTSAINSTIVGINISADGTTRTPFNVENRTYESYMIYAPIPYGETMTYNILQNQGWLN